MRYLLTAGQAKKLDEHAIGVIGFPGLVLMEKAAMTLASVLMEREDRRSGFLFVCGTGNNGGDGLAAARLFYLAGFCASRDTVRRQFLSEIRKNYLRMQKRR